MYQFLFCYKGTYNIVCVLYIYLFYVFIISSFSFLFSVRESSFEVGKCMLLFAWSLGFCRCSASASSVPLCQFCQKWFRPTTWMGRPPYFRLYFHFPKHPFQPVWDLTSLWTKAVHYSQNRLPLILSGLRNQDSDSKSAGLTLNNEPILIEQSTAVCRNSIMATGCLIELVYVHCLLIIYRNV